MLERTPTIHVPSKKEGSTAYCTAKLPYRIEPPSQMEDEMEPECIYVRRDLATNEQQVWVYDGERLGRRGYAQGLQTYK